MYILTKIYEFLFPPSEDNAKQEIEHIGYFRHKPDGEKTNHIFKLVQKQRP